MEKFPRSERTMHPRSHTPPLTGRRFREAKEREKLRKEHDPSYLTQAEAAAIPVEVVAARPELAARIQYSRQSWPEQQAVASIALGPLPTGEGEAVQQRDIPVEAVFAGGRVREE